MCYDVQMLFLLKVITARNYPAETLSSLPQPETVPKRRLFKYSQHKADYSDIDNKKNTGE